MRLEGEYNALSPARLCPANNLVEQNTMTTMHSIVGAHRSHAIAKYRRIIETSNDLHLSVYWLLFSSAAFTK